MNRMPNRPNPDETEYLESMLGLYVAGLRVIAKGYANAGDSARAERIIEVVGMLESLLPARNA